jgi:hypothetical protein
MEKSDLKVGRVYRAKKPMLVGNIFDPKVNDRMVVYIGAEKLQYDSPTVKMGRKLPFIDIDLFLAWADRDVTDQIPEDEWASSI